jgi:hypothetical protein
VTIRGLDLYGNEEKLIIAAQLEGSLNGTVYLAGIPYFDPQTRTLEIKNLDFELDTKSRLARMANWLAHGRLVNLLRDAFRFPLGPQLDKGRQALQELLKAYKLTKGVTLKGVLYGLDPKEVRITPTSIVALMEATGKADVHIEGL